MWSAPGKCAFSSGVPVRTPTSSTVPIWIPRCTMIRSAWFLIGPRTGRRTRLLVKEAPHLPRTARVLELPERLGLDLPDAFAGDRELLPDFLQRVVGVHADAEAHAQHALLSRG